MIAFSKLPVPFYELHPTTAGGPQLGVVVLLLLLLPPVLLISIWMLALLTSTTPPAAAAALEQRNPSSSSFMIRNSLLVSNLSTLPSAEYIWDQLLIEASHSVENNDDNILIIEVGMHTARQCLQAAHYGFSVHCLEPSPVSFARIQSQVQQQQQQQQQQKQQGKSEAFVDSNVHLYNMAASSESGQSIPFSASGSTGDHVGDYDMWNMQPRPPVDPLLRAKQGETIVVPTVRLDDIILNGTVQSRFSSTSKTATKTPAVFLIKVDTQGYEPLVIQGMTNSLASHQIQFVLMEYWPRGMDLIATGNSGKHAGSRNDEDPTSNHPPDDTACTASIEVLQPFFRNGYTIYALPPSSHPRAPTGAKQYLKTNYVVPFAPSTPKPSGVVALINTTTSIRSFCQWFYQVEDLFPSTTYKMGYWADILAVAPTVWHTTQDGHPTSTIASSSSSSQYVTELMTQMAHDQQNQNRHTDRRS